jgi:hypothetical protein
MTADQVRAALIAAARDRVVVVLPHRRDGQPAIAVGKPLVVNGRHVVLAVSRSSDAVVPLDCIEGVEVAVQPKEPAP